MSLVYDKDLKKWVSKKVLRACIQASNSTLGWRIVYKSGPPSASSKGASIESPIYYNTSGSRAYASLYNYSITNENSPTSGSYAICFGNPAGEGSDTK